MQLSKFLAALAPFLLVLPAAAHVRTKCKADDKHFCDGTNFDASLEKNYTCGDPRLGPDKLPTKLPLDAITDIYDPFGGLCPGAFLAQWYNSSGPRPGWNYPPLDGFALDADGRAIKAEFVLQPGAVLDRFGAETGTFVAPAAAPFLQRALPPASLDAPPDSPEYPYNYHVYVVQQNLTVTAGPIAPWFGQPGQGVQYKLREKVSKLVADGVLKKVDPDYLIV